MSSTAACSSALCPRDVVGLYRVGRLIECAAVSTADADVAKLQELRATVAAGESAATDGRGSDVGTANMRFHQAITALAGSPRLDDLMRQLLAELRLVFHIMDKPSELRVPYLDPNREILTLLEAGDLDGAHDALKGYLDDVEQQLLATYAPAEDAAGDTHALVASLGRPVSTSVGWVSNSGGFVYDSGTEIAKANRSSHGSPAGRTTIRASARAPNSAFT